MNSLYALVVLEAEAGVRHNRLVNRSWTTTRQTNASPISKANVSMGVLLARINAPRHVGIRAGSNCLGIGAA